MQNPFELQGIWWLPERSEKKLPGTISFSQENGTFLDILGVFEFENEGPILQHKIILGLSKDGKPITLLNCLSTQFTYPLFGLGNSIFRIHFVFEGAHFEIEEKIQFNQLFGNFTDLDAWVNTFGFTVKSETKDGSSYKEIVEFIKPAQKNIELNDEYVAGISFSSRGPNLSRIQTEISISQKSYMVIKSRNGDVPFDEIFSLLIKFSEFLQIGTQRITYPLMVIGHSEKNSRTLESGKKHFSDINIYFQPLEPYKDRKPIYFWDMLFTLSDCKDENVKQWFITYKNHFHELNLYRTLFFTRGMYINTRFLNITQALETLHSIKFDNNYLPKAKFKKDKKSVLSSVREDLRDWVDASLENGNIKRLKERIIELLNEKEYLFKVLISDIDDFAFRVRDTRNEFIHHQNMKKTFRDREELISATYLLTYLFEAYILEIIGFSNDQIVNIFKKRFDDYQSRWKIF